MSTELKGVESFNGNVQLTRYWGGVENLSCLQVTPPEGTRTPYLSLTREQALELAVALIEFANDKREAIEDE